VGHSIHCVINLIRGDCISPIVWGCPTENSRGSCDLAEGKIDNGIRLALRLGSDDITCWSLSVGIGCTNIDVRDMGTERKGFTCARVEPAPNHKTCLRPKSGTHGLMSIAVHSVAHSPSINRSSAVTVRRPSNFHGVQTRTDDVKVHHGARHRKKLSPCAGYCGCDSAPDASAGRISYHHQGTGACCRSMPDVAEP